MLIEIQNDIYFINSRLKEIDEKYQIYFNTKRNVFEVHNKGQIGDSYCLTIPYSLLDQRTIDLINKTKIENKEKILKEIEKNNEKIEKIQNKRILNNANDLLLQANKYLS
ncbi:MAG: hypothetical protein PHS54_02260 [Clostridia bacterium]|nr:hypothetical protein [Clostridia bacterium]